uniref:Secreted protein n=1 Tax=Anopheles dirus TaxID=7168 RepID=A0A182NY78_9DIPT
MSLFTRVYSLCIIFCLSFDLSFWPGTGLAVPVLLPGDQSILELAPHLVCVQFRPVTLHVFCTRGKRRLEKEEAMKEVCVWCALLQRRLCFWEVHRRRVRWGGAHAKLFPFTSRPPQVGGTIATGGGSRQANMRFI